MATYLLTWNPGRWTWDDLEDQIEQLEDGRSVEGNWSTGNRKSMEPGSRLFLVALGAEPRGLIGSGWACGQIYEGDHWSGEPGRLANYVPMRFDTLLDIDDVLPVDLLEDLVPEMTTWHPQGSGIEVPLDAVVKVERLWAEHCQADPMETLLSLGGAVEGQASVRLTRHFRRDRRLRKEKLRQHAGRNSGSLPCEIPGCGFDFRRAYGEIGDGYAHVHHVEALAGRAEPNATALDELRVVCANCHAMIHYGNACRSIEEIAHALELVNYGDS